MNCPICHSSKFYSPIIVPDHEYGLELNVNYVECQECHSLFQQHMPMEEVLKSFYPENYHSFSSNGFMTKIRHQLRMRSFQSALLPGTTVLDFGCGKGQFIQWAGNRFPAVEFIGFEFEQAHFIEKRNNVTLIKGNLMSLLVNIPSVDVLLMNHVIEHLPDPIDTLVKLRTKLRPNGQFMGQTPRAGSLEHRIFGAAWSGFHAPRHTVIFSAKGMKIALERAGYSKVRTLSAFNPAALAISLASCLFPAKRKIQRTGAQWFFYLLSACVLAPLDRLLGPSGIMNFKARVN